MVGGYLLLFNLIVSEILLIEVRMSILFWKRQRIVNLVIIRKARDFDTSDKHGVGNFWRLILLASPLMMGFHIKGVALLAPSEGSHSDMVVR